MELFDLLDEYGAMFEEPTARAAPSAFARSASASGRLPLGSAGDEAPLGERLFWPLLMCIAYFCTAMLLGAALG